MEEKYKMYEVVMKLNGEECSCGEFYSKEKAIWFIENLYDKEEIDSETEIWIE